MRQPLIAAAITAAAFTLPLSAQQHQDHAAHAPAARAIQQAVAAKTRTPANAARDPHRHPAETLAFFGVEPDDTVVELWPGGGWYTEILAPLTAQKGSLWVMPPAGRYAETIAAKIKSGNTYAKVRQATFAAGQPSAISAGSADVVLTFRNVHNWMGGDAPIADAVFAEAFRVLKPGGTLGVVEHRLPEAVDAARERESGYLKESTVIALAEKAGFRLVGRSEINANPKDTHDHPEGVWTLPPSYRLGDKDRARYQAIGESDRMTLRFEKPRG